MGGTAVLKTIAMYEEMFEYETPGPYDVPIILATGVTREENQAFSHRLSDFERTRHGMSARPHSYYGALLTHSGIYVRLERLSVSFVAGLPRLSLLREPNRRPAVERFLGTLGIDVGNGPAIRAALESHIVAARPFSSFLDGYRQQYLQPKRGISSYRTVLIGIPIPSLIAYNQADLAHVCALVPGLGDLDAVHFKDLFVDALIADVQALRTDLADRVIIARTTGVGGMFDITDSGEIVARLGFAHAGRDRYLVEKQQEAERLTERYIEAGADVLVTAAAIGIDAVHVRETVRMNKGVRQKLYDVGYNLIPNAAAALPSDAHDSRQLGEPAPRPSISRCLRH